MEKIKIPTGYIIVDEYSKGKLETLSIGDYGKSKNIKADFLGYTKELNGVPNGECISLQEKWVITLSTQYGCPEKCTFCDVPKVGFKGNATVDDLKQQLFNAIECFPEVRYTDRLNIHFARMGEPAYNIGNIYLFCEWLKSQAKQELITKYNLRIEVIHPVFTTMMPIKINNNNPHGLEDVLFAWSKDIKYVTFNGQAGLQLSINSTNEDQRKEMYQNRALSLKEISRITKELPKPIGRKYCLNFALADGYETDGKKLKELFDPDDWMVKITPIHNNNSCKENGIQTVGGYQEFTPYKEAEESFKEVGFDVLVFIPSFDEEDGCVTCGNVILGGSELKV